MKTFLFITSALLFALVAFIVTGIELTVLAGVTCALVASAPAFGAIAIYVQEHNEKCNY